MGITYTNAAQAEVHDYEAAEEILDAVKISSPGIHTMKFKGPHYSGTKKWNSIMILSNQLLL